MCRYELRRQLYCNVTFQELCARFSLHDNTMEPNTNTRLVYGIGHNILTTKWYIWPQNPIITFLVYYGKVELSIMYSYNYKSNEKFIINVPMISASLKQLCIYSVTPKLWKTSCQLICLQQCNICQTVYIIYHTNICQIWDSIVVSGHICLLVMLCTQLTIMIYIEP